MKTLGQMLIDRGILEQYVPVISMHVILDLKSLNFVSEDGTITCDEEQFASIVMTHIPESEITRLAQEGKTNE